MQSSIVLKSETGTKLQSRVGQTGRGKEESQHRRERPRRIRRREKSFLALKGYGTFIYARNQHNTGKVMHAQYIAMINLKSVSPSFLFSLIVREGDIVSGGRRTGSVNLHPPQDTIIKMPEYSSSFSSSYSSSRGYSSSSSSSSSYSSSGSRWVPAALGGSYTIEVRY